MENDQTIITTAIKNLADAALDFLDCHNKDKLEAVLHGIYILSWRLEQLNEEE